MSVDGVDCKILRQMKAHEAFNSHKFGGKGGGPGLRYEVGLCILTGDIVWVLGPFPCGDWPDINIFRFALKHLLEDGERVEADDGYVGEDPLRVKTTHGAVHNPDPQVKYVRARVRLRHETVNKRIKQFECMKTVFRHAVEFHGTCFRACAVLTQLSINNGNPLFEVGQYLD